MSQIYKVLLQSGYDGCPSRIVAIRPGSDTFEGFVDAIFMRFPDLNRKKLELFYNGEQRYCLNMQHSSLKDLDWNYSAKSSDRLAIKVFLS